MRVSLSSSSSSCIYHITPCSIDTILSINSLPSIPSDFRFLFTHTDTPYLSIYLSFPSLPWNNGPACEQEEDTWNSSNFAESKKKSRTWGQDAMIDFVYDTGGECVLPFHFLFFFLSSNIYIYIYFTLYVYLASDEWTNGLNWTDLPTSPRPYHHACSFPTSRRWGLPT